MDQASGHLEARTGVVASILGVYASGVHAGGLFGMSVQLCLPFSPRDEPGGT